MSADLDNLRRQVAALTDREAIREVVMSIARGVDRFDGALVRRFVLADARLDVGGERKLSGEEFAAMLKPPATPPIGRMHVVSNTQIVLNGDTASAESHVLSCQEVARGEGAVTRVRAGRYLDRFVRKPEGWKLSERTFVDEWGRIDDVKETFPKGAHRGRPAPDDPLYAFFDNAAGE